MVFSSILEAPAPPPVTTDNLRLYALLLSLCTAALVLQLVPLGIAYRSRLPDVTETSRRLGIACVALCLATVLAAQRSWVAASELTTSKPDEGLMGLHYGQWENTLNAATHLSGAVCLVLGIATIALLIRSIRHTIAFVRERSYYRSRTAS